MEDLLKDMAALILVSLLLVLALAGVVMVLNATEDKTIIRNCEQQGWHNFGQTRVVCMVEPKKEVK